MSYEFLVLVAKVVGPIWMMGFLLVVLIRTWSPRRREAYDRAARSVLTEGREDGR